MKASLYCLCLYLHSVIWLHVAHPPDEETKALGGAVTLLPSSRYQQSTCCVPGTAQKLPRSFAHFGEGGRVWARACWGGGGCLVHLPHLPVPSEGPDVLFPACTSRDEVKKKSPF